jgi:EAL domain-containing protein (putative c-di-GMP-specific phosphodiesterase class I)
LARITHGAHRSAAANDDRRADLARDLCTAIADEELSVFLQPIVDLADGTTAGYEVLLRWFHPTAGQIDPETIMRLACQARLADALTFSLMARAIRAAAGWRNQAFLAINVAASQLTSPRFVDAVLRILDEESFAPERLVLEVTEHEAIAAPACNHLARLRASGVAVALDDFGQSHANLAALESCRFDKLKLDRAFASSAVGQTATIQQSAAQLARKLGMSVVAEGLETMEQVQMARTAGCTHGQGYWFGRPMPSSLLLDQQFRPPSC